MDLRGVLKSVPFYVMLSFGMVNVIGGFFGAISQFFGTPVLPVTRIMLNVVDGTYVFIVFIIIVYYTGELVHRERECGVARYVDAAPFRQRRDGGGESRGDVVDRHAAVCVVMLTSMAVQAGHGYFRFETDALRRRPVRGARLVRCTCSACSVCAFRRMVAEQIPRNAGADRAVPRRAGDELARLRARAVPVRRSAARRCPT